MMELDGLPAEMDTRATYWVEALRNALQQEGQTIVLEDVVGDENGGYVPGQRPRTAGVLLQIMPHMEGDPSRAIVVNHGQKVTLSR